jgi:hypothetical protein
MSTTQLNLSDTSMTNRIKKCLPSLIPPGWNDVHLGSFHRFTDCQLGESEIGEDGFSAIFHKLSAPISRRENISIRLPETGREELIQLAQRALKAMTFVIVREGACERQTVKCERARAELLLNAVECSLEHSN